MAVMRWIGVVVRSYPSLVGRASGRVMVVWRLRSGSGLIIRVRMRSSARCVSGRARRVVIVRRVGVVVRGSSG